MKEFEYVPSDLIGAGHNPMIPGWQIDLGTGADGKHYMCKITPTNHLTRLMWNVDFDNSEEWIAKGYDIDPNDDAHSMPFYRVEVLYAKDYHKAARVYYQRETVEYKDIYKTVCAFCDRKGIN